MTDHAPSPSWIRLDTTPSTNSYLASHPEAEALSHGTVCVTRCQSAGKGQRGNSWEAAPGLNITMSVLLRPERLEARAQFAISEAVALAVHTLLRRHLGPEAPVAIKWPNDIYVADRKICGILIENTLDPQAHIRRSIAGIGLNVNQTEWLSDAPNPVSMRQLSGRQHDLGLLEQQLAELVLQLAALPPGQLHSRYLSALWRADGYYPYVDAATAEPFEARISAIDGTGRLTLTDRAGRERTYGFKEVKFVINPTLIKE